MNNDRPTKVVFADERVKKEYSDLKESDPTLYKFISRALDDLEKKPDCGIHISKNSYLKLTYKSMR